MQSFQQNILGRDVEIGPYAVIGPNVVIGEGTKVSAHNALLMAGRQLAKTT